ncbi:MAG: preprotein translocase subunit SecE [Actinomycetota bacterium]
MSMDLNRQQKRAMQKMGEVNEQGAPVRQARPSVAAQVAKERVGPVRYLREVRDEMRKVAWPKWPEIRRYSIIVLVTVVIITAFVGGLDAVFGILSGWLYKD